MLSRFFQKRAGVLIGLVSAILFLFAAFPFPETSRAASMVRLNLDELIERSDLIIQARVISGKAEWSGAEGRSLVFTYTGAGVLDVYKGTASARVIIRTPGGSLDGYNFIVPGSPRLKPGRELVLFLRYTGTKRNGEPVFDLIGLEQAVLPVIKIGEDKVVQLKLRKKGEGSARAVRIRPGDLRIQVRAVMENLSAREKNRQ